MGSGERHGPPRLERPAEERRASDDVVDGYADDARDEQIDAIDDEVPVSIEG